MFVNKFWNFVWLVEVIEKYLATSGSPKVFVNCRKNILNFGDFTGLIKIIEK